jgi:hypothetical protein
MSKSKEILQCRNTKILFAMDTFGHFHQVTDLVEYEVNVQKIITYT